MHMIFYVQSVGELLHLASAKGHLDIVKYLIEDCHVDPTCVGQVCMLYVYVIKCDDWICQ